MYCITCKGVVLGLNIGGVEVDPGSCSLLRFIYLFVCLNVYVKWYFVLSTTHAKLVDCVTAIKQ